MVSQFLDIKKERLFLLTSLGEVDSKNLVEKGAKNLYEKYDALMSCTKIKLQIFCVRVILLQCHGDLIDRADVNHNHRINK